MSPSVSAVPRDFFCEHGASKHRVFVRLERPDHYDAVQAVLTCTDPSLAARVVVFLRIILGSGDAPHMAAERERIAGALPDAVAASFRRAYGWTCGGAWPVPDHAHFPFHTNRSDYPPHPWRPHTPDGVRLADLSGDVVRVFSWVEMHVHDADRMLAAARAAQWEPNPTERNDPDDVVGAVLHLTRPVTSPGIPGAHLIDDESTAELLDDDDELAAWDGTPLAPDFEAPGWRLDE